MAGRALIVSMILARLTPFFQAAFARKIVFAGEFQALASIEADHETSF
jgi:hypothetical protein